MLGKASNVLGFFCNMICAGYTWGGSSACQVRRDVN